MLNILAAPPWLQRDWDYFVKRCDMRLSCSTSLTSKGLRRAIRGQLRIWWPCSTSLTSKGLRQTSWKTIEPSLLAAPPWLQRDWDYSIRCVFTAYTSCSTSLTSKGLRQLVLSFNVRRMLAAPPWLQRDWDKHVFPHCFTVSPCSTSLTSKGLRQIITGSKAAMQAFLQHLPDFKGIETENVLLLG